MEGKNLPLGVADEHVYTSAEPMALDTGDLLLLPTDGIWESLSNDDVDCGQQRMLEIVTANRSKSASEIAHLLCEAARGPDPTEQKDDITAVIVKRD